MEDNGTKITIRIPEDDLKELEKLVPSKFINTSDAVRAALRLLLQSCKSHKLQDREVIK